MNCNVWCITFWYVVTYGIQRKEQLCIVVLYVVFHTLRGGVRACPLQSTLRGGVRACPLQSVVCVRVHVRACVRVSVCVCVCKREREREREREGVRYSHPLLLQHLLLLMSDLHLVAFASLSRLPCPRPTCTCPQSLTLIFMYLISWPRHLCQDAAACSRGAWSQLKHVIAWLHECIN